MLGPVIVELVFILEQRWHLRNLQERVPMVKILFGREAEVNKCLRFGG